MQETPIFEMILKGNGTHASRARAVPLSDDQAKQWTTVGQPEGQLAVDVHETKDHVVVVSTMAGAATDEIEVHIHNDLLTIRGRRPLPSIEGRTNTFYTECFWGPFSRSVVLPVDVKADLAQAEYTNGVLVVRVPKRTADAKIPVTIVEE